MNYDEGGSPPTHLSDHARRNNMHRIALLIAIVLCASQAANAQIPDPEKYPNVADEYEALGFEETKALAEEGIAGAQYKLGLIYANGDGVLQDYFRAHMWLNIASSQGNAFAPVDRNVAAGLMMPDQISEARTMARQCMASNYADC